MDQIFSEDKLKVSMSRTESSYTGKVCSTFFFQQLSNYEQVYEQVQYEYRKFEIRLDILQKFNKKFPSQKNISVNKFILYMRYN